jgi:hypothetical protein
MARAPEFARSLEVDGVIREEKAIHHRYMYACRDARAAAPQQLRLSMSMHAVQ